MSTNARRLSLIFWIIGLAMSVIWLPSLDRYLGARYHSGMEPVLSLVFPPSWTDALLHRQENPEHAGRHEAQVQGVETRQQSHASESLKLPPNPPNDRPANTNAPHQDQPRVLADVGGDSFQVQILPPGKFMPTLAQQKLREGPQRILFAGDSMMQGVAPFAMRELAKQNPEWKMFDESRQSTGLTVRRYFDWPTRIVELMDARDLTLVVVFLGPNDPWDIAVGGKRHVFPTDSWVSHYASRVDEIQSAAKQRGIGVIWMGLPAMREARVHDGAVLQNQIFHARAKAWGTDFLSTEPLVGLLSEPYQKFLKDDAGQAVNLRAEDGIHFNTTGLKRMSSALVQMIIHSAHP